MNEMHVHSESTFASNSITKEPNVHLLLSVFLTNKTLYGANFYGDLAIASNKLDQFLTTLHSISQLNLVTQDFYISFDEEYCWAQDLVNVSITRVFPNARVLNYRLDSFDSWQDASALIPKDTDVILLKTNHDHAFVSESVPAFERFVRDINTFGDRYIGGITHWPEMVSRLGQHWAKSSAGDTWNLVAETNMTIGTCLVSRSLFLEWWKVDFTEGKKIVRPDNPFGPSVSFKECPFLVPSTEFFRHLDGYGHVGITSPSAKALRGCCTFSQNEITHRDWVRGFFSRHQFNADLPSLPSMEQGGSFRKNVELALLSTSHRINLRTIYRITKTTHSRKKVLRFLLLLLSLSTNRYFLAKTPASIGIFTRVTVANFYRKMQAKHTMLPPTLRDLADGIRSRFPK